MRGGPNIPPFFGGADEMRGAPLIKRADRGRWCVFPRRPDPRDELTPSFDHLVGERAQRRWNFEAEHLGGLEINHKFVFRRRLDRQVTGLLALEDTINVTGGLAVLVNWIGTI